MEDKMFDVREKYKELGELYPIDYGYGSRQSVFENGLRDGKITREEYEKARDYYGNLWNYAG